MPGFDLGIPLFEHDAGEYSIMRKGPGKPGPLRSISGFGRTNQARTFFIFWGLMPKVILLPALRFAFLAMRSFNCCLLRGRLRGMMTLSG